MARTLLVFAVLLASVAVSAQAQVRAGGEFQVNSYSYDAQWRPSAAFQGTEAFVVTWISHEQDGHRGGTFGRRVSAAGAFLTPEFQVNTYTTDDQLTGYVTTAVSATRRRGFVVVWTHLQQGRMYGRLFDAAGSPRGAEFLVNSATATDHPAAAMAENGRFVVTWLTPEGYGLNHVSARVFDTDATPLGPEIRVSAGTSHVNHRPRVAVDDVGNFVVVWTNSTPGDGWGEGVFGQLFEVGGTPLGGNFRVNSYTPVRQSVYGVARAGDGRFVVSWAGHGDGSGTAAVARRFDATGNPQGGDLFVNAYTTGYQQLVNVAIDDSGAFVLTWQESFRDGSSAGVFARRVDGDGVPRGADFQVNTVTLGQQFVPKVASDQVGNFVVTWASADADTWGVFAQRFGGLVPAALAVDTATGGTSDGNRVLEACETVDVRPSWRNVNGAPQAIAGRALSLTGPPGAVYAVPDPSADYGLVGNGSVAPCADCYEASVSCAPVRPAHHWDAVLTERLLPDAHGQTQLWRLHVGDSFDDVPRGSPFYRFVETLLHHRITAGCAAGSYCSGDPTTREQMAALVLASREGPGYLPPACGVPRFVDVPPTSPFCRWIEELTRRAVVTGCGPGLFCPGAAVTREQAAVFVLRTLDPTLSPPACTTPRYPDVPASSPFCRWIEELTRRGVVTGCGGGLFCPSAPTTREQMAVLLSVAFGLSLYGP